MSKISKIIIQTARTRDLSPLAKASATNLKLLHPDWEYRFFDDADIQRFITQEFPEHRELFEKFPHAIQRIDFFRYLAIYRFGGFYFDLDVFLSENLSPLLGHASVFPFEELTLNRFLRKQYNIDWEIGNYAFGAAPRDPFLGAVIENCVKSQKEPEWVQPMMAHVPSFFRRDFNILNTTGPGILTRTLAANPEASASVVVLFPSDVCDEKTWHMFGHYGIHAMEGSWRTKGNFLRRKFGQIWETRTRAELMPESTRRGKTRSFPTNAVR